MTGNNRQHKRKNQHKRNRAPRKYTGPVLKQQVNPMNTLNASQQFFVRALAHCHAELEQIMYQISKTPARFQKALRIKKAKLQREAEYIIKVKLEGVTLWV